MICSQKMNFIAVCAFRNDYEQAYAHDETSLTSSHCYALDLPLDSTLATEAGDKAGCACTKCTEGGSADRSIDGGLLGDRHGCYIYIYMYCNICIWIAKARERVAIQGGC